MYGWAQGVARLNSKLSVDCSNPSDAHVVFLSKQLSLLGTGWAFGDGFRRDFTLDLNQIEIFMED